jgi:transaldolase
MTTTATTPSAAVPSVQGLRVQIYADGADRAAIADLAERPYIAGFTTNPTLMRKAGITDYGAFAREVLQIVGGRGVSFEVVADTFPEMEREARVIASWGRNVYVKIPVTDSSGAPSYDLVHRLSADGVQLNVTALLTLEQVQGVSDALDPRVPSLISLFAGRLADTGRDPVPVVTRAVEIMKPRPAQQLVWASPREVLNVFQADAAGCHVITVTREILDKLAMVGMDPAELSLETVRMFLRDARAAGFAI